MKRTHKYAVGEPLEVSVASRHPQNYEALKKGAVITVARLISTEEMKDEYGVDQVAYTFDMTCGGWCDGCRAQGRRKKDRPCVPVTPDDPCESQEEGWIGEGAVRSALPPITEADLAEVYRSLGVPL